MIPRRLIALAVLIVFGVGFALSQGPRRNLSRHSPPAAFRNASTPRIWTLMIASLSRSTSRSSLWMSS